MVLQWADRLCNGAAVQSPKPAQGANAVDAASLVRITSNTMLLQQVRSA